MQLGQPWPRPGARIACPPWQEEVTQAITFAQSEHCPCAEWLPQLEELQQDIQAALAGGSAAE